MKTGFTTTILHSDLESPIEHFSVHKPMHVAAAYGYPDAHDLARVFKGEMPGYSYGRQGNPTATALESKVTLHQQRQTELIMRRADVLHDPPYPGPLLHDLHRRRSRRGLHLAHERRHIVRLPAPLSAPNQPPAHR